MIRVHIEGGGDGEDTKRFLREGFHGFFSSVIEQGRSLRVEWKIVVCGGRQATYNTFTNALEQHSDAFNILLVDSEDPVSGAPWAHLCARDGWDQGTARDDQAHLMIQVMETWLICDPGTLQRYYGQGFHLNSLPKTKPIENAAKNAILAGLRAATKKTSKGEYGKIRHAAAILPQLDVARVRSEAPSCDRLFLTLERLVQPA